jgi:hypothetical protein
MRSLAVLRIIWCAIIGGQIVFLSLILSGKIQSPQPANPIPFGPLIAWAMLIVFGLFTFGFRSVIFRKFQINGQIPVRVYSTGSIIFWAGCEGVSFAAMVFGFVSGSVHPYLPIVFVALALQALTYPLGSQLYTA